MRRLIFVLCLLLLCILAIPLFAENKNKTIDLDGMPDLIVNDEMRKQWVVRDEKLQEGVCSVEEGGVTPGVRRLIRFTVMTPNIGDADLYVGDPNEHIAAGDGLFEFASCHGHYHFQHYALYELLDPGTGFVWRAAKRGFCMLDTDPVPKSEGTESPRAAIFRSCGAVGIPGNQGISHGWADTYRFFLGGQYFVLDGGDGQAPVPPGDYQIRVTVNPPYAPNASGLCPRVKDAATGLCHQFAESNYANNVNTVLVTIPDHPGRQGVGPMKDTAPLGYEPAEHDQ